MRERQTGRHAEQLAALGHPIRLAILRFVVQGGAEGAAAGATQDRVDMPASTLSHHLKRLVDAGLLSSRSEGTFHYYTADYKTLRALADYVWEDCSSAAPRAAAAADFFLRLVHLIDLVCQPRSDPRARSKQLAASASLLITMGCGEACPVVPGLERASSR